MMENLNEGVLDKLAGVSNQSDTPLIRWSVIAIAAIAVWVWIVEPLQVWNVELEGQLTRNSEKVARLLALEKNAELWLEADREINLVRVNSEKQLFAALSDTQAQAQIQGTLREMADRRDLDIESQKLLPPEPVETVGHKLGVEVGLRGELIDALYFLNDLGRSEKLLLIDRWIIQIDRLGRAYIRCSIAGVRPLPAEVENSE